MKTNEQPAPRGITVELLATGGLGPEIEGTAGRQRRMRRVATDHGPGVGRPEDNRTTHWLGNRGTIPAVEFSVAIANAQE